MPLRCCLQGVRTQRSESASNPRVLLHIPVSPFGIKAVPSRNSTRVFNQQRATAQRGAEAKPPPTTPFLSCSSFSWFCSPCAEPAQAAFLGRAFPAVRLPERGCGSAEPACFRTWLGLACGMLSERPDASCSSLQDNCAEVEQARGCRGAAAHLELKDLHIWYIQYLLKVTATLPFGRRPGAPCIAQRIKIHSCIFFEGKAKITLSAEPRLL